MVLIWPLKVHLKQRSTALIIKTAPAQSHTCPQYLETTTSSSDTTTNTSREVHLQPASPVRLTNIHRCAISDKINVVTFCHVCCVQRTRRESLRWNWARLQISLWTSTRRTSVFWRRASKLLRAATSPVYWRDNPTITSVRVRSLISMALSSASSDDTCRLF